MDKINKIIKIKQKKINEKENLTKDDMEVYEVLSNLKFWRKIWNTLMDTNYYYIIWILTDALSDIKIWIETGIIWSVEKIKELNKEIEEHKKILKRLNNTLF